MNQPRQTYGPGPFEVVCFDCDSTLSRVEGIDELAARCGVLSEIAPMTNAAMEGGVGLDEIYGKRLMMIRPDKAAIEWLSQRYIEQFVKGAREIVAALYLLDKNIQIISGGIRQAILPLARELKIPSGNVHAVDIHFDAAGGYSGFDEGSALITPGGKAAVCEKIIARHGATAMIGDGLTDIAARAAGAFVIGFGGVVRRKVVVEGADCYFGSEDIMAVLDILLNDEERAVLKERSSAKARRD